MLQGPISPTILASRNLKVCAITTMLELMTKKLNNNDDNIR